MERDDNLKILMSVCAAMQARGIVASKAEFSTRILGKSPSYLSSMVARNRRVDDTTISELKRVIETWIETPDPIQICRPSDLLPVYVMISAFERSKDVRAAAKPRTRRGLRRVSGYRWWRALRALLRPSLSGH